jgi:hypothetical protein
MTVQGGEISVCLGLLPPFNLSFGLVEFTVLPRQSLLLGELGFELRDYSLSHSVSLIYFVVGFFKIGSREVVAWAAFEL